MKKTVLICVMLLAVIITGVFSYFQWIHKPLHTAISSECVADIQVYGLNTKMFKVDDEMLASNIIKWFNSASGIRPNKNFEGTTSESGIILNLKSGKRILILRSGMDFEIQRDDVRKNNVSYWAKQKELKEFLDMLAE